MDNEIYEFVGSTLPTLILTPDDYGRLKAVFPDLPTFRGNGYVGFITIEGVFFCKSEKG